MLVVVLLCASLYTVVTSVSVDFSGARYLPASNGTRLFSWFFPHAVASQPLVLWLNGGPGCSSLMGLFYEIGPYAFDPSSGQLITNPHSWAADYHLLFVDSPVGTGLSYGPGIVTDEAQVAADLQLALAAFFSRRPALRRCDLFLATESYGGKYAPFVARMLLAAGYKLRGVAVGNGLVDPINQVSAFAPFARAYGFVDAAQAAAMAREQLRMQVLAAAERYVEASDAWDNVTVQALNAGGWFNPADVRLFGFPAMQAGEAWINAHRTELGVPPERPPFEMCNDTVGTWFAQREMVSVAHLYTELLDVLGLSVLFFNGDMDFTIPTSGVEAWLALLQWSGRDAYAAAKRTIWRFTDSNPFDVAGYVRQAKGLTFVSVVNAGHSVCQDQRLRSREMMGFFVANKPFPQGQPFPPSRRRRRF